MKQIKGFAPILMVIVTIAIAYFFSYPQWTKYNDTNTALKAAETQNVKLKQSQTELTTFLSQYNSSSNVAKVNKILPIHHSDLENILANFDSYATTSGVSLTGLTFADAGLDQTGLSKVSDYQLSYVEMNLAATGGYASFRTFLTQIEKSLRLVDITSVNLAVGQNDNLEYKLAARVYYQK